MANRPVLPHSPHRYFANEVRQTEITVELQEWEHQPGNRGYWKRFATMKALPAIIVRIVDHMGNLEGIRAVYENGQLFYQSY